jgi:hypothetical protein
MPLLEPVIWAKGTVLNPQHLQIQDRFVADSLVFHLHALNFRPWGFQRLRIDEQALAAGTLAIAEAAGIMADGRLPGDPAIPGAGTERGRRAAGCGDSLSGGSRHDAGRKYGLVGAAGNGGAQELPAAGGGGNARRQFHAAGCQSA